VGTANDDSLRDRLPESAASDQHPAGDRSTIVIADSDPLAARIARDTLEAAGGFTVVGVARSALEASDLTIHYGPDVVLLETGLPGSSGTETIRLLAARAPSACLVVFSRLEGDDQQLDAIAAGAVGFLPKSAGVERLPDVIRSVLNGEAAVSRRVTKRLIERFRSLPADGVGMRPVWSDLTTREWQILDLISQGKTTREMAAALYLTEDTIYGHVKAVLRKLEVRSREEAIEKARELRRPSLEPHVVTVNGHGPDG
jgi:DNA-binding NarL/FixJ family response regulator